MALWRLTPVLDQLDHPFWARSLNKEPVSVIAENEDQAREKAMAKGNNDNAVDRIPGTDVPFSPGRIPFWSMQRKYGSNLDHTDRQGELKGTEG